MIYVLQHRIIKQVGLVSNVLHITQGVELHVICDVQHDHGNYPVKGGQAENFTVFKFELWNECI